MMQSIRSILFNKMLITRLLFFGYIFCIIVACSGFADTQEKLKAKFSLIQIGTSKNEVIKTLGKPNIIEPHLTGDCLMWKDRNDTVRIKIKFIPKVDRVMTKSWED